MLQALWNQLQILLGLELDISDVNGLQMALRTIIIYAFTLAIIRLGSKRFLSKASAFDVIVGIMLGSVIGRAINGSAPFFPTLAAGAVLIGLHWLLAVIAVHIDWFGPFQEQEMQRTGITTHDLNQALRHHKQTDPSKIETAYLERDGQISITPFKHEPRVLDVSVADGVQTVRVEIE